MSLSSAWNLLFLAAAMRLVEKGTLLCLTAISYCLLQGPSNPAACALVYDDANSRQYPAHSPEHSRLPQFVHI